MVQGKGKGEIDAEKEKEKLDDLKAEMEQLSWHGTELKGIEAQMEAMSSTHEASREQEVAE